MRNPELSIVVPLFNEAENIEPLHGEIRAVLDPAGISFECIFVDDGSTDGSLAEVKALAQKDAQVRYVALSRNFGHEAATSCGLRMVRGRAAVLIDADLQDPPSVIPQFHAKWRQGYDIVYGVRAEREGEGAVKRVTSYLFYRVLNLLADVEIPADTGDFRLMDRRVVDHFNSLEERNRFVRGMVAWLGFRQTGVEYRRKPRHRGETKYSLTRLLLFSLDAIASFSAVPLRICTITGFGITLLSLLMTLVIGAQKIFFGLPIPGYALMTSGMFFLGGTQLFFLGIVGMYIGKIYTQVQARPLYIVSESSEPDSFS